MKRFFTILCAALSVAMSAAPAAAQYPSKQIRLVVPTPAGGPSDVAARTLGQALSRSLGQPVIVENKPGAGGAIAAQAVMTAAPDGYTFLWTLASMAGIPMLQKSSPFQSLAELTPVSLVGSFAFGVFVHPGVPAQSTGELVAHLRSNPDKLNYGTGTLGEYMATTQFLKATGTSAVRVPYRGGPQLMPDLLNGRVQMNIGPLSGGLPHVKENRLRLLAVLLPQRAAVAPDVPTLAEAGITSVSLPTWQAILAPPRTPRAIAERMSREIAQALNDPGVRGPLEQQGILVQGLGPEEMALIIARDTEAWRNFVRDYDIPQE
jgi:tripartite-type tricarboxylate transporter receptor subunit TctC